MAKPKQKPVQKPAPRYVPQFVFDSTELSSGETTPLLRADEANIVTPRLFYTDDVWNQIWYLVDKCPMEVGWLGLVEPEGDDYLVTDIFVPEQEVCGSETDISPNAMAALAEEIIDMGRDPGQLIYWGHSHVNMGVRPSNQDEEQIDRYLSDCPLFIRGIYNKMRDSKVDIYDVESRVVHQCVDDGVLREGLTGEQQRHLDKVIKSNVKQQKPSNPVRKGRKNSKKLFPDSMKLRELSNNLGFENLDDPFFYSEQGG